MARCVEKCMWPFLLNLVLAAIIVFIGHVNRRDWLWDQAVPVELELLGGTYTDLTNKYIGELGYIIIQ